MKCLLDTHVLIWLFSDKSKLTASMVKLLNDGKNEVYVCSLSFWEISIKASVGKFDLGGFDLHKLASAVKDFGFEILDPMLDDYISYSKLPLNPDHRDPFDRMLINVAIRHGLQLVSSDAKFGFYKQFGLKLAGDEIA